VEYVMAEQTESTALRIVRAPFFLLSVALSLLPLLALFASVSIGAWFDDVLTWLGYEQRPRWLPAVLGVLSYAGLGIAAPAFLGNLLIGWPGAVAGPVLALALIAVLGRW